MNPAEVEFLTENQTIQVIPNFSHDRLYLICGEVGPFRPGIPVTVPLWMGNSNIHTYIHTYIQSLVVQIETKVKLTIASHQLEATPKVPTDGPRMVEC